MDPGPTQFAQPQPEPRPLTPQGAPPSGRPPTGPQVPPFMPPSGPELAPTLTQLQGTLNTIMATLTSEQQAALRKRAEFQQSFDHYEKTLSPWAKIWKVLGILAGIIALLFGAGVAYQKAIGDNATKTDLKTDMEKHVAEDLVPVKEEVQAFKLEMKPVKIGVASLVATQEKEKTVKKVRRLVERHDRQYEQLLGDYTADKAAGRRTGPKPTKTPEHLKLETELETLEGKL